MLTRRLMIAAALLAGTATAGNAGPPWISIEFPANPHHASTRNASFLIHAYHHSNGILSKIDATAIGMVDGKRRTMQLDVRSTATDGLYALRTPLPKDGTWVLSLTMRDGDAPATALVTVDRRGTISKVTVPSTTSKDGWVVPRAVTQKDIEGALQEALIADAASSRKNLARKAAISAPLGLLLAAAALRRRRRSGTLLPDVLR